MKIIIAAFAAARICGPGCEVAASRGFPSGQEPQARLKGHGTWGGLSGKEPTALQREASGATGTKFGIRDVRVRSWTWWPSVARPSSSRSPGTTFENWDTDEPSSAASTASSACVFPRKTIGTAIPWRSPSRRGRRSHVINVTAARSGFAVSVPCVMLTQKLSRANGHPQWTMSDTETSPVTLLDGLAGLDPEARRDLATNLRQVSGLNLR